MMAKINKKCDKKIRRAGFECNTKQIDKGSNKTSVDLVAGVW